MIIAAFDKNNKKHYSSIIKMLKLRNLNVLLMEDLPEFGLIGFEKEEVVAAGFLRKIEGPYAMMDSYITNPEIEFSIRNIMLDRITAKLIKIAKENNVNSLLMFSNVPVIYDRAIRHGFGSVPHRVAVKRLK